jgi:hypothetical protein
VSIRIRAALEFIRKNPGCAYEQFLAAKLRPADLRRDVKLGRVEVARSLSLEGQLQEPSLSAGRISLSISARVSTAQLPISEA